MLKLGNFLLRGNVHAMLAVSALSALSLIVWPLAYLISGAPMALVALRQGAKKALLVALGSVLLLALVAHLLGLSKDVPVYYAVAVWLPVILCAAMLRVTQSQGLMVMCAGLAGVGFTAWTHLRLDKIREWWLAAFDHWRDSPLLGFGGQDPAQVNELINSLASAILIYGFVTSLVAALLLARWWQSALFNPGGFRSEFQLLRLPRGLVLIALLNLIVLTFSPGDGRLPAFRDLLVLILTMYMFQGLSIIHGAVHRRGSSRGWLFGMYFLLFLLPQPSLVLIACVGIVNACLGDKRPAASGNGPA